MDISTYGYLKHQKWLSQIVTVIKMKVVISQSIMIKKWLSQTMVGKPEPGTQGNPKMKNGWPENPEKWSKIEKHSKKMMKKLKKSKKHQKMFRIFAGRKTEK